MDLDLSKYELLKTKKAPNSAVGEQLEIATKILNKPFKQIAGLTKHLSLDQLFLLNKESKSSPQLWWTLFRTKYKLNNMEKIIREKLEQVPLFRERKNRDKYLAILTLRDIGLVIPPKLSPGFTLTLPFEMLCTFAVRYGTAQRIWREILMKNEYLRGSDWKERAELEANFVRKLRQ